MPDSKKPSPETLARVAEELVRTPVAEQELEAIAALLGALTSEMASMRAMDVGTTEPATTNKADPP